MQTTLSITHPIQYLTPVSSVSSIAQQNMPIFSATLGSVSHLSFLSHVFTTTTDSSYTPPSFPSLINHSNFSRHCHKYSIKKRNPLHSPKVSLSGTPKTDNSEQTASANAASATEVLDDSPEALRQARVCVCVCFFFFCKLF